MVERHERGREPGGLEAELPHGDEVSRWRERCPALTTFFISFLNTRLLLHSPLRHHVLLQQRQVEREGQHRHRVPIRQHRDCLVTRHALMMATRFRQVQEAPGKLRFVASFASDSVRWDRLRSRLADLARRRSPRVARDGQGRIVVLHKFNMHCASCPPSPRLRRARRERRSGPNQPSPRPCDQEIKMSKAHSNDVSHSAAATPGFPPNPSPTPSTARHLRGLTDFPFRGPDESSKAG